MKKNKISKDWINKQRKDIYVRRSKIEGYRSRAVYKLEEIEKKFKIFRNGISIIDLGAAPGGWSQYLSRNIKNAKILSIDLIDMEKINNTFQIKGDFTESDSKKQIKDYFGGKVDIVLSDMAANTTGNKNMDSLVTGELCLEAMNFALETLKTNGQFVSKIFMGSSFNDIIAEAKKNFVKVSMYKPASSRKNSKESFIICKFLR